ncbi:MAG: hypothetical protein CMD33_03610 [Flavobacteriales bacterium]|nr:hypothetical protein [Flavobacteriales bacterium]
MPRIAIFNSPQRNGQNASIGSKVAAALRRQGLQPKKKMQWVGGEERPVNAFFGEAAQIAYDICLEYFRQLDNVVTDGSARRSRRRTEFFHPYKKRSGGDDSEEDY